MSARPNKKAPQKAERRWTFLSNHAHALLCLASQPDMRIRDMAASIGITERAVQMILANLEEEGLVQHRREGRRNVYTLHLDHPLRHPLESHRSVRELMELLLRGRESGDSNE